MIPVFDSEGENAIDFKNNISDNTSPCIIVNSKEDLESLSEIPCIRNDC